MTMKVNVIVTQMRTFSTTMRVKSLAEIPKRLRSTHPSKSAGWYEQEEWGTQILNVTDPLSPPQDITENVKVLDGQAPPPTPTRPSPSDAQDGAFDQSTIIGLDNGNSIIDGELAEELRKQGEGSSIH